MVETRRNMPLLFDCLDEKSNKVFKDLLSINHLKKYEPENRKTPTKSHQTSKRNNSWGKKWGKQKVI